MARKGPLRKVLHAFNKDEQYTPSGTKFTVAYEKFECGHEQRIPTDMYGEFYSYRRRCKQCLRSHP